MMVGIPTTANAGTADYVYSCYTPGAGTWTFLKGQRLNLCVNAYIYIRLNGQLVEVVPTNASGVKVNGQISNVDCVVAIVGAILSVRGGGRWGWANKTTALAGLPACLA